MLRNDVIHSVDILKRFKRDSRILLNSTSYISPFEDEGVAPNEQG